jgi:acyl carrier protein
MVYFNGPQPGTPETRMREKTMPTETDFIGPVRTFITENFLFGRDGGLTDSESFLDSGIIDSTGILQLVVFLEKTFSIQVKDEELVPENLDCLNGISRFLQSKQASFPGAATFPTP